jgi:hypothetical protein
MYKIINPYNKFVWEKTIKQVNTHTKYTWGEGAVCFVAKRFFKEEEEIREARWSGHILTITDGFTNIIFLFVNPSAMLLIQVTRHCTGFPV